MDSTQTPQTPPGTFAPAVVPAPDPSRRSLFAAGAGLAVGAGLAAASAVSGVAEAAPASGAPDAARGARGAGGDHRVEVAPGVSVHVSDQRGGDRGTVVFVPGWPLASPTFEYTYQFLADHGYRAVGLDLRGFGRSDAPYAPYGYDVWARDIQTVLRALSLRDVTLVGHSMGGAIALRHAARFGSRVGRLVLAEASAPRFVYGPHAADLANGINGLIAGVSTNRAQTIRSLTSVFFSTHTDIATDPYLQSFERQCIDQASLPASLAGLIALRDTDLVPDMAMVGVPTLVVHAVNDKVVPLDHGQALADGIRQARLVTFAEAGHGVYVDEADKFNQTLLEFIR